MAREMVNLLAVSLALSCQNNSWLIPHQTMHGIRPNYLQLSYGREECGPANPITLVPCSAVPCKPIPLSQGTLCHGVAVKV